ncbi:hypothetical protein JHK82_054746 [Glycine max]|uniref:Uncharacterized protein n=2 Tax=Glycine subgen. Soja TaxID=1462606 RepID=A0A0R0F448_SOYBN|nr:hypothetical protein JHK86_054597 [Glycine max]KAG4917101.1 hypothetical protein JHK87_054658 [Glycine soja]KAG4929067.1 hypothetical protein JHK85_055553 [Glycine max]KAG5084577.1 hypothetical protein JHK84_054615 [Glycine max]KAG5087349.1 hypothetical protein JHK82_054746 [Glycine max]
MVNERQARYVILKEYGDDVSALALDTEGSSSLPCAVHASQLPSHLSFQKLPPPISTLILSSSCCILQHLLCSSWCNKSSSLHT